jgi:hypothetical protein
LQLLDEIKELIGSVDGEDTPFEVTMDSARGAVVDSSVGATSVVVLVPLFFLFFVDAKISNIGLQLLDEINELLGSVDGEDTPFDGTVDSARGAVVDSSVGATSVVVLVPLLFLFFLDAKISNFGLQLLDEIKELIGSVDGEDTPFDGTMDSARGAVVDSSVGATSVVVLVPLLFLFFVDAKISNFGLQLLDGIKEMVGAVDGEDSPFGGTVGSARGAARGALLDSVSSSGLMMKSKNSSSV